MVYRNATEMLQKCYGCATAVLQLYYSCATAVLPLYYSCATAVLLLCYCCTTAVLQLCSLQVTMCHYTVYSDYCDYRFHGNITWFADEKCVKVGKPLSSPDGYG
jgi:hypothetical protein